MANQEIMIRPEQSTAIERVPILQPSNLAELQQLGALMSSSGFFSDARQAAQACVKILAGREMGFPPIASMTGISIIDGKPATGANLLAAAMKRAGYTWRVLQRDAHGCRIVVSFRNQELGPSEFLEEDAKRAGLLGKKNWEKFPRSMYFARAITDAARTYAPEVFAGIPAYTAEELGAEDTTEDGALILPPQGSQAAADHVAQQKIAQLQQASAGDTGSIPPSSQGQKGQGTAQSQSDKGAGHPRNEDPAPATSPLIAAANKAEAEFVACDKYAKLGAFKQLKADIEECTGGDLAYYEILSKHVPKAKWRDGQPHADCFETLGKARAAFRELWLYVADVSTQVNTPPDEQPTTLTAEQFVDGLEPEATNAGS